MMSRDWLELLSKVEIAFARQLASGMTNDEIAAARQVSRLNIDHHVLDLMRRIGVEKRAELVELLRTELPPAQ